MAYADFEVSSVDMVAAAHIGLVSWPSSASDHPMEGTEYSSSWSQRYGCQFQLSPSTLRHLLMAHPTRATREAELDFCLVPPTATFAKLVPGQKPCRLEGGLTLDNITGVIGRLVDPWTNQPKTNRFRRLMVKWWGNLLVDLEKFIYGYNGGPIPDRRFPAAVLPFLGSRVEEVVVVCDRQGLQWVSVRHFARTRSLGLVRHHHPWHRTARSCHHRRRLCVDHRRRRRREAARHARQVRRRLRHHCRFMHRFNRVRAAMVWDLLSVAHQLHMSD